MRELLIFEESKNIKMKGIIDLKTEFPYDAENIKENDIHIDEEISCLLNDEYKTPILFDNWNGPVEFVNDHTIRISFTTDDIGDANIEYYAECGIEPTAKILSESEIDNIVIGIRNSNWDNIINCGELVDLKFIDGNDTEYPYKNLKSANMYIVQITDF